MSIELATVVPDTSGKGLGCNPTLITDKHDEVRRDPERTDKTRKHFEYHSIYSNVCINTKLIPKSKQLQRCASLHYYIFQDQQLITSPHDANLDNTRTCHIQRPSHLVSASLIAFTHSPLVNGFGEPTTGISTTASHVARCLISQTRHKHAIRSIAKVTTGDDLHQQSSSIIIGPLPPADMLINHNFSAFLS